MKIHAQSFNVLHSHDNEQNEQKTQRHIILQDIYFPRLRCQIQIMEKVAEQNKFCANNNNNKKTAHAVLLCPIDSARQHMSIFGYIHISYESHLWDSLAAILKCRYYDSECAIDICVFPTLGCRRCII